MKIKQLWTLSGLLMIASFANAMDDMTAHRANDRVGRYMATAVGTPPNDIEQEIIERGVTCGCFPFIKKRTSVVPVEPKRTGRTVILIAAYVDERETPQLGEGVDAIAPAPTAPPPEKFMGDFLKALKEVTQPKGSS